MGQILFVTGTDTGVGKTFVSALLIANLRQQGVNIGVCKPVETGCDSDGDGSELHAADAALLNLVNGNLQDGAEVCPYRYVTPVAPIVAGELEKNPINGEHLQAHLLKLAAKFELLVVEGAGGLLVPLAPGYTYADLAEACAMKILVVVGSKLGALNHAALTFEAVRGRKLELIGYVLNDLNRTTGNVDAALVTNPDILHLIAERYGTEECCYLDRCEEDIDLQQIIRLCRGPQVEYLASIIRRMLR